MFPSGYTLVKSSIIEVEDPLAATMNFVVAKGCDSILPRLEGELVTVGSSKVPETEVQ